MKHLLYAEDFLDVVLQYKFGTDMLMFLLVKSVLVHEASIHCRVGTGG